MSTKLRWRVEGEAHLAQGLNVVYIIKLCDSGLFAACTQAMQGRMPAPQPAELIGAASTVAQCQWLCEQHAQQHR
jgi:hypothetical protein